MLTAKQEAFARAIAIDGMSLKDAYLVAYDAQNMAEKTVYEKACILSKQGKITERIAELRAEIAKDGIMTAQERAKWLTEVIASFENAMPDKLKALDILNKMTGEYVQKVEANVNADVEVNVTLSDEE